MIIEKPITAALIAGTATAYFTADPNLKRAILRSISFRNSNTVAETLTVHLVPLAGSASDTNMIVSRSLNPGETYQASELDGKTLEGGGMLQCLASTTGKISIAGTVLLHSF
jgi:hypothetical protein